MRGIIAIFILAVVLICCKKKLSIVGHWRPLDEKMSMEQMNDVSLQFRDLLLNSDSTFISVGLEEQPKQLKGWHIGGTQKGKWSFLNDTLSLYVEGSSVRVNFKIFKLTEQEIKMKGELMDTNEMRLIKIKDFG